MHFRMLFPKVAILQVKVQTTIFIAPRLPLKAIHIFDRDYYYKHVSGNSAELEPYLDSLTTLQRSFSNKDEGAFAVSKLPKTNRTKINWLEW